MRNIIEQLIKEIKDQYFKYDNKEFEAVSYKEKIHNQEILVILNFVFSRLQYLSVESEKQENYIKQLEAQISRDRESLIKEGEFVKKYLGDQKEWINE